MRLCIRFTWPSTTMSVHLWETRSGVCGTGLQDREAPTMRSALVDILVIGPMWAVGFGGATFLLGLIGEGSIEAALRNWSFLRIFDTWDGAVVAIAITAATGLALGRLGRWAKLRRERNRR